jgi:5'-nucleotidase
VDLFLSASEEDVQSTIDAGVAEGMIYKESGLEAFLEHEKKNAMKLLPEGPFAKLLKTLSYIQNETGFEKPPIRTALVTARNSPAHERVPYRTENN